MVAYIKSVTFDCGDVLAVATFWAAALGSDVDEDSTTVKAWVEPAGWGGPEPVVSAGARGEDRKESAALRPTRNGPP
ncbi:MAG: VOC family protein [Nocardioidaceae bacterium]